MRYVLRDMTHPEGGFYSAEDADSEGKEGKFYCWTKAELKQLLTAEEFECRDELLRHHGGRKLRRSQRSQSVAEPKRPEHRAILTRPKGKEALLASAKKKMFDVRAKRVRPHLDDKVLASWNGLMLGAIARAGVVLGDDNVSAPRRKRISPSSKPNSGTRKPKRFITAGATASATTRNCSRATRFCSAA